MAKTKKAKKAVRTAAKKGEKKGWQATVPAPVQEALQVTWQLNGAIKVIQIAYIRACKLLHRVREEKLWAELKHPDMVSYAWARLKLKRSALYEYLDVYDWMAEFHPQWLLPHPKGFIPGLSDATEIMWMDRELKRADLEPARRAGLEELRAKGLKGELKEGELARWRRQGATSDTAMKSLLLDCRRLRKRAGKLVHLPPKFLADMDDAISELAQALGGAGNT